MNTIQNKALVEVVQAMYDSIASAGEVGLPSGHLYAICCGAMSLEAYEKIISALIVTGKIQRHGHILTSVRNRITIPH